MKIIYAFIIALILSIIRKTKCTNFQNEMYIFERGLNGAKVIKNTDRQGAYPCFFCLYILYRVVGSKDFYTLLACAIAAA